VLEFSLIIHLIRFFKCPTQEMGVSKETAGTAEKLLKLCPYEIIVVHSFAAM
jgi:hypothetical protein